jgi:glucosamine--fructose-6-phosphate aminotransferase (isomerizing)
MCGIVGCIGYRDALPILLNSLKRLEYRGYDSCGVAVSSGSIKLYKDVGQMVDVEKELPPLQGKMGIGHTRWATHGEVSCANAHPHLDCSGKIAVVHNGVIENFLKLRKELEGEGHHFISDTDTEVIPHLIEKYYRGNLREAVARALADIEGTYAVIVLAEGHHELIAARRESPLIVGVGDGENFIASDATAVLDYTDRVLYLEDDDIVVVSEKAVAITNNGQRVERKEEHIPWDVEEVQRGGYEHFMLKEIHEQDRIVEDTYRGHISLIEPAVDLGIEIAEDFEDILLVACGTSYHAALIGEYLLSGLCGVPIRVKVASEFNHRHLRLDNTWVIGITQSGETSDTLRALRGAEASGCKTLAITNIPGSSVTRIADEVFLTQAGLEIGVAATKTFLAQLTSLYLLASSLTTDIRTRESLLQGLRTIPAKVQQVLDGEGQIAHHAQRLSGHDNAFFIGRGINYPVAMEGALKLKEVSYLHAEAYPGGELKHGPFALVRQNTPVIAIASRDDTYEAMLTNIKEVKARGPWVIALAEEGDVDIEQFADDVIRIPQVDLLFSPFLNSVALQLLAYYTARERGCPIDLPANLAKSVTVP